MQLFILVKGWFNSLQIIRNSIFYEFSFKYKELMSFHLSMETVPTQVGKWNSLSQVVWVVLNVQDTLANLLENPI